jgi:hypothetical protein
VNVSNNCVENICYKAKTKYSCPKDCFWDDNKKECQYHSCVRLLDEKSCPTHCVLNSLNKCIANPCFDKTKEKCIGECAWNETNGKCNITSCIRLGGESECKKGCAMDHKKKACVVDPCAEKKYCEPDLCYGHPKSQCDSQIDCFWNNSEGKCFRKICGTTDCKITCFKELKNSRCVYANCNASTYCDVNCTWMNESRICKAHDCTLLSKDEKCVDKEGCLEDGNGKCIVDKCYDFEGTGYDINNCPPDCDFDGSSQDTRKRCSRQTCTRHHNEVECGDDCVLNGVYPRGPRCTVNPCKNGNQKCPNDCKGGLNTNVCQYNRCVRLDNLKCSEMGQCAPGLTDKDRCLSINKKDAVNYCSVLTSSECVNYEEGKNGPCKVITNTNPSESLCTIGENCEKVKSNGNQNHPCGLDCVEERGECKKSCSPGFVDDNDDGICSALDCESRSFGNCLTPKEHPDCVVYNNNKCVHSCPPFHLIDGNRNCVEINNCYKRTPLISENFPCGSDCLLDLNNQCVSKCPNLYDDKDGDGICMYFNCVGSGPCVTGCVLSENNMCSQSCINKNHYSEVNGVCMLKANCDRRINNKTDIFPCGPECLLDRWNGDVCVSVCSAKGSKYNDTDKFGICQPLNCSVTPNEENLCVSPVCKDSGAPSDCKYHCANDNGTCKFSCSNKNHYENVKGKCTLINVCSNRRPVNREEWPCAERCLLNSVNNLCSDKCPDGDDDSDGNGICSPTTCNDVNSAAGAVNRCGERCVLDIDGICEQSCKNRHHYYPVNKICELKPDCSNRRMNESQNWPCGENCYFDALNNICTTMCPPYFDDKDSDGVCAPENCVERSKNNSPTNPCGEYCVLDIDGETCRQSCKNKHHFKSKDGICVLISNCSQRSSNKSDIFPCGFGCYKTAFTDKCIDDGNPNNNNCTNLNLGNNCNIGTGVCPSEPFPESSNLVAVNDFDNDGVCALVSCIDAQISDINIEDYPCGSYCVLDLNDRLTAFDTCRQSCSNKFHYRNINGKCTLVSDCTERRPIETDEFPCGTGCLLSKGLCVKIGNCEKDEDDADGDGICAPQNCSEISLDNKAKTYPCGLKCVADCRSKNGCPENTDMVCVQSCQDKYHYENKDGWCKIKRDCNLRRPNLEEETWPCFKGCVLRPESNKCEQTCANNYNDNDEDGICGLNNCEDLDMEQVDVYPCGLYCVADVDRKCHQSCSNKNLYINVSGVCKLKEDCNHRRPTNSDEFPCGNNCLYDVVSNACTKGSCFPGYDDADNDGICAPGVCQNILPDMGSPFPCGQYCVLDSNICKQSCGNKAHYKAENGVCKLKQSCSERRSVNSTAWPCGESDCLYDPLIEKCIINGRIIEMPTDDPGLSICEDRLHYEIVSGRCEIKPDCIRRQDGDEIVWWCGKNHCSGGYDDFDGDGICSLPSCPASPISGSNEPCGSNCVLDVDGKCRQSCKNRNHYYRSPSHPGKCTLKPACSDRLSNSSDYWPCGMGCYYNSIIKQCTGPEVSGCEVQVSSGVEINPCTSVCVLDIDQVSCKTGCSMPNIYYNKGGRCKLKEKCIDRTPGTINLWPCGPSCLLNPLSGTCVGSGCPVGYDDRDEDGICAPSNCESITPEIEQDSLTCKNCVVDIDGTCKQSCSMNTYYESKDGKCVKKEDCISHIINGEEIWNCQRNYCSTQEDDFDQDGICAPSDCFEKTRFLVDEWPCSLRCVEDVDGKCKQSCENKKHYKPSTFGTCILKGCTERLSDNSYQWPCGSGCLFDPVIMKCVEAGSGNGSDKCSAGYDDADSDGICSASNCSLRQYSDGCGLGCVADKTSNSCRQSCGIKEHYINISGACVLMEVCENRKPVHQKYPCGEGCAQKETEDGSLLCVVGVEPSDQSNSSKHNKKSFPWYIIVIIGVVGLLVISVLVITMFLYYNKQRNKRDVEEREKIRDILVIEPAYKRDFTSKNEWVVAPDGRRKKKKKKKKMTEQGLNRRLLNEEDSMMDDNISTNRGGINRRRRKSVHRK